MASLGFHLDLTETSSDASNATNDAKVDSLSSRMGEVQDILAESGIGEFDLDAATAAALTGIASSSDTPAFEYLSPERLDTYLADTSNMNYQGVGCLFAEANGQVYVADIIAESSAAYAGVMQGDVVVSINGENDHAWTMAEVVNTLAMREGENVVITWMRPSSSGSDTGEEFSTTLLCSSYTEPNLSSEIIGEVGYIKLSQITSNAASLVQTAIENLSNQGATSFVLDLRNNPGGYLTQACDIASLFLQSGTIVQIDTADGVTSRSTSGATITSLPLAVIVNEYTSAAAEVLAGALQDNQRATIVGVSTRGKGTVQVTRELSFGGGIRFTAAAYKTPLGRYIEGQGISPDVEVSDDSSSDIQKSIAVETADSLAGR